MQKKDDIVIIQLDNGYLVDNRNGTNSALHNSKVFQTMEELKIFIESHFTVRNCNVQVDMSEER